MNVRIICISKGTQHKKATGNNDSNNKQCHTLARNEHYMYICSALAAAVTVAIITKRARLLYTPSARHTLLFVRNGEKRVYSFIFIQTPQPSIYIYMNTYQIVVQLRKRVGFGYLLIAVGVVAYSRRLPVSRRVGECVPFTHFLDDCLGCVCFFGARATVCIHQPI